MERAVSLMEVLDARERRAARQKTLLEQYRRPVISFCMNIAGPVKCSPVICRGFREGKERLDAALSAARLPVIFQEERMPDTGCEALWVVDGPGRQIKELCVALEERDPLGRLLDLDVLDERAPGGRWDREALGEPPRPCLICGDRGRACASRRLHSAVQLQKRTDEIFRAHFARRDREELAALAMRALLYEVSVTPKPGLVDRENSGSHGDMDFFRFLDSAAALLPYWMRAVEIGQETAAKAPERTFPPLREAGIQAERAMFRATGGVNTHKGAVFSMGCALGACGRLWTPEGPCREAERILTECRRMAAPAMAADWARLNPQRARTGGEKLYVSAGLRGGRGEAADGFPSVLRVGLPALRGAIERGSDLEEAGIAALLALIARAEDTNLVVRGGPQGRRWAAEQAERLLRETPRPSRRAVRALDQAFTRRNLSPGGCADLLAMTYFLHFLADPAKPEAAAPGAPSPITGPASPAD